MLEAILMIVAGAVAAMSLVAKKVKNSEEVLKKIVPYQGYIGVVLFIWGVWGIISSILRISWMGDGMYWLIWWITYLGIAVIETLIGFLLGFGLISKYALSKNEAAQKKGEEILAKLAGYQSTLGIIAICIGIWAILWRIIGPGLF